MFHLLIAESVDFSFAGMWAQMGLFAKAVMIGLIVMFVIALAIIFERLRAYHRAQTQSVSYIIALRTYLNERKIEEAVAAAEAHPDSPVAKVVRAGLKEYLEGVEALREQGPDDVGDFDIVDAINRQMERTKERETASLKRGLGWLATTGSTAPFVGLLGTVVGIITAFQGLSDDGGGGLSSVAGGISEALVATAVGLLVAIPAVMLFNYFNARVESYQIDMNDVASELVNFVLKEGRY
jgi:biopolymer transport protein ExbB